MKYKKHIILKCPYCFHEAGFKEIDRKGCERYQCKFELCKKSFTAVDQNKILHIQDAKNSGLLKKRYDEYFIEKENISIRIKFLIKILNFIDDMNKID